MSFRSVAPGILLVLITLVAYQSAIVGGFIWDDNDYVTDNQTLRSFAGLVQIWTDPSATPQYYPLVHTSYWIEYHVWGLWPVGYHLVNVLIHGLNAVLLWYLLRRLRVPAAWFVALVFALHPVHVESVAWITERKNLLSGLFYLSAVHCLLRAWDFTRTDFAWPDTDRRWYAASLVCFLLAMWSKTVAATFPAAICVLIWWQRGHLKRAHFLLLAPMFVIGIGLGLLTVWLEKNQVGASGIDWDLSIVDRCLIAGRAIVFYATKLVLPIKLTFIYPRWQIDSTAAWQYLFPAAVLAVMLALWALRHRIGRGPLAAVLLFAGTLFPALGFFDVYPMRFSFVADHFQYLASVGLIALIVATAKTLLDRLLDPDKPYQQVAAALVAVLLAATTWQQGRIYSGLEVLWRDTLAKNPGAFLAHCNLGAILTRRGDYEEAEVHLRTAVRIKPDFVDSVVNLAKVREDQRDFKEAETYYLQALQLRPDYLPALNGLGAVYGMQGRTVLSEQYLTRALEIDPDDAKTHGNLATLFAMQGRGEESIQHFRKAIALDPTLIDARLNLARFLISLARWEEAQQTLEPALELNPDEIGVLLNLGVIAGNQQQYHTAIGYFEQVVSIDPNHLQANYNLAAMYDLAGQPDRARHYGQIYQRLRTP